MSREVPAPGHARNLRTHVARRSMDAAHSTAAIDRDDLRPARGVLFSVLLGAGIWALVFLAFSFIGPLFSPK